MVSENHGRVIGARLHRHFDVGFRREELVEELVQGTHYSCE
jgi:hypothetical protein